jgi:hypothetical protein
MSELSNGTKKHTSKSRETIPLRCPKKQKCPTEQYICKETFVIELGQQGYQKIRISY